MRSVFWISSDGERWGRITLDRHGNQRTPLPDEAHEVDEVDWRRHLQEVRDRRDRAAAQRSDRWHQERPEPGAVLRPAHGIKRLLASAASSATTAQTLLAELAPMVDEFESGERVTVESKIETDNETWAELSHRLRVELAPPQVGTKTSEVIAAAWQALNHMHGSARQAAARKRNSGTSDAPSVASPPPGFPVPTSWPQAFLTNEWTTAWSGGDERLAALLAESFGTSRADTWDTHPARLLHLLRERLTHGPVIDVAAVADVLGDGQTRVNGMSVGFDITLPDPKTGTGSSLRYELLPADRSAHLDQLDREIARCEALPDHDASFAMYSREEELAELRRERQSWTGPWEVKRSVRTAAQVVLSMPPHQRVIPELEAIVDFVDHCLNVHRRFVNDPDGFLPPG